MSIQLHQPQSKFNSLIAHLAIVAIIIPYASFAFVFPSDVQPLAGVLAVMYLIRRAKIIRLDFFSLFFLLFALFYLINVDRTGSFDYSGIYFRKHLNLIYAFFIYLFGRHCVDHVLPAVRSALILLSVFGGLQLFHRDLFLGIAPFFTNVFRDELGTRGISSLAPEPTDLGFTMLFVFLLIFFLAKRGGDLRVAKVRSLKLGCGLLALATLSGSAFVGFFVAAFAWIRFNVLRVDKVIVIFLLSAIVLSVVLSQLEFDIRPLTILLGLLTEPMSIIGNTSLSYRVVHFLVGPAAVLTEPLGLIGYGVGSSTVLGPILYDQMNLEKFLHLNQYYADQMVGSFDFGYLLSSAGQLMLEAGVFGLLFILWVLLRVYSLGRIFGRNFGRVLVVCYLMYFFQSFPLSWPLPWFLLGLLSGQHSLGINFANRYSIEKRL